MGVGDAWPGDWEGFPEELILSCDSKVSRGTGYPGVAGAGVGQEGKQEGKEGKWSGGSGG